MMKRVAAILLCMVLCVSLCLSASAEKTEKQFDPGNMSFPEGMTPPDGSGFPEGMTLPEGMNFPEGMTPPEGMSFPEGTTPPDGMGQPPQGFDGSSFPGGFPGGSQGKAEGQLGSWSSGGTNADSVEGNDYAYDAALYVTADGIDAEKSSVGRITSGTYDEHYASGITISDSASGHNGVIVTGTEYTLTDVSIDLLTEADGTDTCDFSGKGTAVAAFGSDTKVTVENSKIHTSGVAAMPLFADSGATLTLRDSTIQSDGGTLYKEYLNTPSQTLMVAPPWILGIMGTSRALNIMGDNTTVNVIDSDASAGAWAVLSTDNGSDMTLNVYNSTVTLNNADESAAAPIQEEGGQITETLDNPYTVNAGAGYGTFVIGNANETIAGSSFNVGTYATIFTGGSATYTALEAGRAYELKNSAGETTETYEAREDRITEIHSDTFGFMAHQGSNSITLEKGTVVDSGYATFLIKTGYSNQQTTAAVDDTVITNGGVLIQIMDNDDATNGGMMSAADEANTNGGAMNFKPVHTENAGFSTAVATADSTLQTFAFTNGDYTGNIYNASGSDGLNGSTLNVAFGVGARYSGAVASTSAIHVTCDGSVQIRENGGYAFDDAEKAAAFAEAYQNTEFTINEYWGIGQVANMINDNGANAVNVTLTDDAVWQVTGTSLITSLNLSDSARVIIPEGVTLTVGGTEYTDCTLTADSVR